MLQATILTFARGKAEAILTLLEVKGAIPPEVKDAIYAQTDMDMLNRWLLLASGAVGVEEFIKGMA